MIMYNIVHLCTVMCVSCTTDKDFNPDVYIYYSACTQYAIVSNLQPNTSYNIRLTRIEGGGCIRRVSEIIGFETRREYCISDG